MGVDDRHGGNPEHTGATQAEAVEHLRSVLERATDLFILVQDGIVLYANGRVAEVLGYQPEEVVGRSPLEFTAPEYHEPGMARVRARLSGERVLDPWPCELIHRSGERVPVEMSGGAVTFEDRPADLVVIRDVHERHLAVAALRRSEERFRALAELLPMAVWELDAEGRFTFVNRKAEQLWGYPNERSPEGVPVTEMFVPEERERIVSALGEAMRADRRQPNEYLARRSDGSTFPVLVYSSPIVVGGQPRGLRGVCLDLTEQRRAERQSRELESRVFDAQRAEALARLAGGVAHEFNNSLTAILANAELAAGHLPAGSPALELLGEVVGSARRAAALVRQMLAYSGRGRFVVSPLDLSATLREVAPLLSAMVRGRAQLRFELAEGLPWVRADASQVHQLAVALVENAAEALGDGRGEVVLRTGAAGYDRPRLEALGLPEAVPTGSYVALEVSDTGCGMDEATRARIFEPFFSTKFVGRGLGLAAVDGIVRGHGGAVAVASSPDAGTTVTVLLPEA